ncbi:expressed unknown protein [Seminavis robusta]|uniref:Uncharacterized protein n=1 Tax=Seminavis robusta TaxID=568900 RepID=A0A9N8HZY8_9STRA|nr:expressed unknown protein [Seminavis robusta]|eukprot:Sro3252_g345881.1  (177) ;mRNA; r:7458-7988
MRAITGARRNIITSHYARTPSPAPTSTPPVRLQAATLALPHGFALPPGMNFEAFLGTLLEKHQQENGGKSPTVASRINPPCPHFQILNTGPPNIIRKPFPVPMQPNTSSPVPPVPRTTSAKVSPANSQNDDTPHGMKKAAELAHDPITEYPSTDEERETEEKEDTKLPAEASQPST